MLPTCLHEKFRILLQEKPDSSLKMYAHKKCITKHKTYIKTREEISIIQL